MGMSPFECQFGFPPPMFPEEEREVPAAEQFVLRCRRAWQKAHASLLTTAEARKQLHSDVDKGDGNVKYVLTGEGASSIFTIDENTGDIHATKRLDREEQGYYTLRAQAVDRETNIPVEDESEFIVKVQDINDNEPKFPDGPYTAGVPEMSPLGE
ncbi:hypothetical protein MHYP_G00289860 [Metynnis hypsauchen]